MIEQVIIAGTGPAGYTAAIYTARANLRPLVIEGTEPGGQLMITTEVENFPGFETGVNGPQLMDAMRKQAERFGARFRPGRVQAVNLQTFPFRLVTEEEEFQCLSFIVATGASARMLGLETERKLMGHGLSTCATCDGFFFRDKEVLVVGGGDSAMEEANFLTKYARRVWVVHRREALRATRIMQDRALRNPKIEFIWDTTVRELHDVDAGSVTSVTLENVKTRETRRMPIDGVFLAIGHDPNTGFLKGELAMDEQGYLLTHGASTRTDIEGVFAAGDVMDPVYRQAITAAGTGCRAAIDCDHYLEALKEKYTNRTWDELAEGSDARQKA